MINTIHVCACKGTYVGYVDLKSSITVSYSADSKYALDEHWVNFWIGLLLMQLAKRESLNLKYRSTIAGSSKNNPKNKKRKNQKILKTEEQK